jgi:hypothetical protein
MQLVFPRAKFAVSTLIVLVILAPGLVGIYQHRDVNWYGSTYYRNRFAISENLLNTLSINRTALNSHRQIAVLGLGPGGIDQSPWQRNGETAFYLSRDLGLTPRWILFVRPGSPSYLVDDDGSAGADPEKKVIVKDIAQLKAYPSIPRLVFDARGNGILVDCNGNTPTNSTLEASFIANCAR